MVCVKCNRPYIMGHFMIKTAEGWKHLAWSVLGGGCPR